MAAVRQGRLLANSHPCSPVVIERVRYYPVWYLGDTIRWMAMTLRLTDEEQAALRERAALEGASMQEAARRAVREYIARGDHRDRVAAAAELITQRHADALQRLGE